MMVIDARSSSLPAGICLPVTFDASEVILNAKPDRAVNDREKKYGLRVCTRSSFLISLLIL